jgi:hypothetical protein
MPMFSYLLYKGKLINESYGESGKERNSRNIGVAHLDLYTKYLVLFQESITFLETTIFIVENR